MGDSGHGLRRALSWLPSPGDGPIGGQRQFGSTEHLSAEALAAFVDGELRMAAHLRAAQHLSMCPQCAAEVDAQYQARSALRDSLPVMMPTSLLGALNRIPQQSRPPVGEDGLGNPGAADIRRDRRRRR